MSGVRVVFFVKFFGNFILLVVCDKSRNILGKVLSEFVSEDLGYDVEKDEGRFFEMRVVYGKGFEGGFYEGLEVWMEDVSINGVSDSIDSVGGDILKVVLFVVFVEFEERNELLDGLIEVRDEFFFGGVGSRIDSIGDSDFDGDGIVFKEDKKLFYEEGEVVYDVVIEDFEVRVEISVCVFLGGGVNDEVEEDGDDDGVLGSVFFSELFVKIFKSDISSFLDNDFIVLEIVFDYGLELVNVRLDVFVVIFDGDIESYKSWFLYMSVIGGYVDLKLLGKNREDLLGRKNLGEVVEGLESELRGWVFVDIFGVVFIING